MGKCDLTSPVCDHRSNLRKYPKKIRISDFIYSRELAYDQLRISPQIDTLCSSSNRLSDPTLDSLIFCDIIRRFPEKMIKFSDARAIVIFYDNAISGRSGISTWSSVGVYDTVHNEEKNVSQILEKILLFKEDFPYISTILLWEMSALHSISVPSILQRSYPTHISHMTGGRVHFIFSVVGQKYLWETLRIVSVMDYVR